MTESTPNQAADTSNADVEGLNPDGTPKSARKLAPIPPSKSAGAGPARNADGTFAATGERVDDGGLPDILRETDSVEDDYDRAKVTLDGGVKENIKPKVTQKTRARDVLVAPKPEGAPAVEAPEGGVAPLPEGAKTPEEGGPEGDEPDQPLEIKGKLVIAGHEYRDIAHLDQAVKSMAGMISSESKRSAQRAAAAKSNYEAAIAWQGQYNALREKYEGASPTGDGGTAPGSTPSNATGEARAAAAQIAKATGETAETVMKSLDWDRYKKIRETHDAETAIAWMVDQAVTKIQQRYDARIDEMQRPAKEQSALIQEGSEIGQQMDALSEWKYDDSITPIYPELADPDAYDEIAQVVVAMHNKGLPLSFFKTPEGINQAILTWRDWRVRNRRPWSASGGASSASTPNASNAHSSAIASVRAAAGPGALVGRSAPARPAAAESGRGADIVRGITESNKPTEYGWAR